MIVAHFSMNPALTVIVVVFHLSIKFSFYITMDLLDHYLRFFEDTLGSLPQAEF